MLKTRLLAAAAALMSIQLPSCSFSASVETMLSPPRLTAEQEQIYQALQAAAGSSVRLKYPRSGERRAAFTVEDLDGDGADEAIAFYEVSLAAADENPLRLCLLVQRDGKWRAVSDYPTAGAEVERIDVSTLGSNPRTNLIVSYNLVDGGDHTAEVYHLEDGGLERSLQIPYTILTLRDLNGSGETELLSVTSAKLPNPASAAVYSLDREGQYLTSQISLPETFTDVSRLVCGMIPQEKAGAEPVPAFYLDGSAGPTTVQTAVLAYSSRKLSLIYADSADHIQNTARPAGCQTFDIDGDGEAEIPVQAVFYGYAADSDVPQPAMTNWYVCRNGLLMRERASYYSPAGGYAFLLPARWERRVTAVPEDDEIVFYEFDKTAQSEDGAPVLKAPLLRLTAVTDAVSAEAMQEDGYILLRQTGGTSYLARRLNTEHPLALSDGELITSMCYFA